MKIKGIDIVTDTEACMEYCDITVECSHGFIHTYARDPHMFIKWLIEKFEQEIVSGVCKGEE